MKKGEIGRKNITLKSSETQAGKEKARQTWITSNGLCGVRRQIVEPIKGIL